VWLKSRFLPAPACPERAQPDPQRFSPRRPLIARDRLKPPQGIDLRATASCHERALPPLLSAALFPLVVGSIASQCRAMLSVGRDRYRRSFQPFRYIRWSACDRSPSATFVCPPIPWLTLVSSSMRQAAQSWLGAALRLSPTTERRVPIRFKPAPRPRADRHTSPLTPPIWNGIAFTIGLFWPSTRVFRERCIFATAFGMNLEGGGGKQRGFRAVMMTAPLKPRHYCLFMRLNAKRGHRRISRLHFERL